jgi:hypothetical protein
MSYVVASKNIPKIDLALFERDFFDGAQFLLQDSTGAPWDLNDVTVCASIYKKVGTTYVLVTAFNTEKLEPLRNGQVRIWLSSEQTAALEAAYDAGQQTAGTSAFFPTAYASQADSAATYENSNLYWDLRIETQEQLADLVSVTNGAFIAQTDHGLGSSERIVFSGAAVSTINYNGTSARIYSSLSNISYVPPYSFTAPTLSGVTDAAIGGSVYRLKQDTVVVGNVVVNSTVSNCFP